MRAIDVTDGELYNEGMPLRQDGLIRMTCCQILCSKDILKIVVKDRYNDIRQAWRLSGDLIKRRALLPVLWPTTVIMYLLLEQTMNQ